MSMRRRRGSDRTRPKKALVPAPPSPEDGKGLVPAELGVQGGDSLEGPVPGSSKASPEAETGTRKGGAAGSQGPAWRSRWPTLPSYVPFGHLYLLGVAAAEPLSGADFVAATTIRSVIAEVRDRFQSHTMRSYRSRFESMYGLCMAQGIPFPAAVLEQLPKLNPWMSAGGTAAVQPGAVAAPLVVRAATSVVPLGWTGEPGENGAAPLRVDVQGFNLHLCTKTRAFVNGRWWGPFNGIRAPPVCSQLHISSCVHRPNTCMRQLFQFQHASRCCC